MKYRLVKLAMIFEQVLNAKTNHNYPFDVKLCSILITEDKYSDITENENITEAYKMFLKQYQISFIFRVFRRLKKVFNG